MICFYYKSDSEVREDQELQNWIKDIFDHGFLAQECTGDDVQGNMGVCCNDVW